MRFKVVRMNENMTGVRKEAQQLNPQVSPVFRDKDNIKTDEKIERQNQEKVCF